MIIGLELLRQLSALPDWAVLTDQQTSQVLGLSVDTLRRLDRGRNGPPWVKLSPRRRGRPVGGLRKWIKQRVSASFHEPQMPASADTVSSLNETDAGIAAGSHVGSNAHRALLDGAGGIATDAKPQADKSQTDALRIIIEPTKSGRKWIARLGNRVLCVAAAPFVKSARLLLAEGYPAHSFIEMWRSNTAEWALRGRLGAVAATVLDGEKAPRDAKNGSPVQDLARGGTGAPCPIPLTPIGAVGRSKRARR
jgi:hypothetical protein